MSADWRERLHALRDALDAAEAERRDLEQLLTDWPEHRSIIEPAIDAEAGDRRCSSHAFDRGDARAAARVCAGAASTTEASVAT